MTDPLIDLTSYLLMRLTEVRRALGLPPLADADADTLFADAIDSMGLVEFLLVVACDCGVPPATIEACAQRQFGTVRELVQAMTQAGLKPLASAERPHGASEGAQVRAPETQCWLGFPSVRLPGTVQSASQLDAALHRPPGWLEARAGIRARRLWNQEDPLAAAAAAGRECLEQGGLHGPDAGALLVTSEAPPLLTGLAAALHHRLELSPSAPALEIGGACTGFLAALWTARALAPVVGPVLIVALEAASRWLNVEPGPAGEAAALFGDGTAACVVGARSFAANAVPIRDVVLGADGSRGDLLQVQSDGATAKLLMNGKPLAHRAIRVMSQGVRDLVARHGLVVSQLAGVAVHGGNGRMPASIARQLDVPAERVWSETAWTGNLGSASLPVAWSQHRDCAGPIAWAAVGAGLTWGLALTGPLRQ